MYDGLELYQELAQWDRAARTHVENECQWVLDATTLSMSQQMHRIHNEWSRLQRLHGGGGSDESRHDSDAHARLRQYEVLVDEVARGCEWLETQLPLMHASDRAKLLHHRLTVELPAMTAACESALLSVQDGMVDDRGQAVQQEVEGRAARRHRQHRLMSLEATQATLKQDVARMRTAAGALTARAEQRMQQVAQQRAATFDRFAQWDLLRRQLAHLLHNQRVTDSRLAQLGDDVTHGFLTHGKAPTELAPHAEDDGEGTTPKDTLDYNAHGMQETTGPPTALARVRSSLLPGSVEWLHRLGERWRRMLARHGSAAGTAPITLAARPSGGGRNHQPEATEDDIGSGLSCKPDGATNKRSASPNSTHAHSARVAAQTLPILQTPRANGIPFATTVGGDGTEAAMAKTPPPTPHLQHPVLAHRNVDDSRPPSRDRGETTAVRQYPNPRRHAALGNSGDDVGVQRLVGAIFDAQGNHRGAMTAAAPELPTLLPHASRPLAPTQRPAMPNLGSQHKNEALRAMMARRDEVSAILSGAASPRGL